MKFGKYKVTNTLDKGDYTAFSVLAGSARNFFNHAQKKISVKTYKHNKTVEIKFHGKSDNGDTVILRKPSPIALRGTIEAFIEKHF